MGNRIAALMGIFDDTTGRVLSLFQGDVPSAVAQPLTVIQQGTLAQMLATTTLPVGSRWHTTDTFMVNGVAATAGNDWVWDGTVWRPYGPQTVIYSNTLVSGALQTAEQIVKSFPIPAGLLYLQRFRLDFTVAKPGLVDILNLLNIRLGPAGTTADPLLGASSTSLLLAAKRSVGISCVFEVTGTNTVVRQGTGGFLDSGSFSGAISATVANQSGTLTGANLQTTAQVLTFAETMTTAASDVPQIGTVILTLLP